MSAERLDVARAMLHRHVETGGAPSAAAMVLRRGQVVFAEAAGVQGPDGPALTLDHIWPIASAGKPMTAAVILSLVEEGLVGINEPVAAHLPELADHPDVLVHHLLTHTAGWESAQRTKRLEKTLAAGEISDPPPGRDLISHMMLTLAFDPIKVCEPGDRMDYDNGHYTLLSEIVRRVTGDSLDAAMRARLFEPLGMTRSAVIVGDDLKPDLISRAAGLPFGPDAMVSFESELWEASDSGASGVHMSMPDLAVFGQMILDGGEYGGRRLLSRAAVRSMVTDRIPGTPAVFGDNSIPEGSWGYGFTVITERPFAYFTGGLLPEGCVAHPGAGGISYWIDFVHEIVGVWFEVITEISEFMEPVSGIGHRFQDVIVAAVDG